MRLFPNYERADKCVRVVGAGMWRTRAETGGAGWEVLDLVQLGSSMGAAFIKLSGASPAGRAGPRDCHAASCIAAGRTAEARLDTSLRVEHAC